MKAEPVGTREGIGSTVCVVEVCNLTKQSF